MILKRKQAKPVGVGDICTIKPVVISKMMDQPSYTERSVSYIKEIEGDVIYRRNMRKNLTRNNEITVADIELAYVSNSTRYKGIVEVIPLKVRADSITGTGIRTILSEKKTFLMRLNSLNLPSLATILDVREYYTYMARNYVEKIIKDENHYNKPEFSWEDK